LKEILGMGKSMAGRFLFFNALHLDFQDVKIPKNPSCPLCGENPTIRDLVDYTLTCPTQICSIPQQASFA
jgi:adenylyltransferase/sulfurtransferase